MITLFKKTFNKNTNFFTNAIIYDNLYFHQIISNVFCLRKNLVSTNIPGKFSFYNVIKNVNTMLLKYDLILQKT